MLKTCKHSNCAVCKNINERDVFKSILQTIHPEIYICEHAMYKITNSKGWEFILPSLEYITKGSRAYFVRDIYTAFVIYLNRDNFEVVCSKEGECEVTPYVAEYIQQQKRQPK